MKNFLVISSTSYTAPLFNFFTELKNKGHSFYWLSSRKDLMARVNEMGWPGRAITLSLLPANIILSPCAAIILPIIYILVLIYLFILKLSKKTDTVICFCWQEKIIFTPIAKLLKVKIIWFECPHYDLPSVSPVYRLLFKFYTRWARVIALNNLIGQKLEIWGIPKKNITRLDFGIRTDYYARQENIFSELAQAEHKSKGRQFFTIGAAADLNGQQNIEVLFQAVKKCLDVIPDLQVMIAGDGPERKNLTWLAKKMNIDSLVWFVGEQINLKKWLDTFDIYVITGRWLTLKDIDAALQALSNQLPLIGPAGIGLDDFVRHNKNGLLINGNNSEDLTQAIIKLRQNKKLRQQLGQAGKETVDKNFTLDKMVEEFEYIVNKQ